MQPPGKPPGKPPGLLLARGQRPARAHARSAAEESAPADGMRRPLAPRPMRRAQHPRRPSSGYHQPRRLRRPPTFPAPAHRLPLARSQSGRPVRPSSVPQRSAQPRPWLRPQPSRRRERPGRPAPAEIERLAPALPAPGRPVLERPGFEPPGFERPAAAPRLAMRRPEDAARRVQPTRERAQVRRLAPDLAAPPRCAGS